MRINHAKKGHHVVAVAYDRLRTFEFGCVVEFFAVARPELNVDWYRFTVCTADKHLIHAVGGIRMEIEADLDVLATADTIIIPAWRDINETPSERLLHSLRDAYRRGARICSICTGVFVLAAAGLLHGKSVTTHWHHARLLAQRYPDTIVLPSALYVDQGQIMTSAGSAAGLDMLMHLVKNDYGHRVANMVAQRLVIPFHREGSQQQLIKTKVVEKGENRIASLVDWLRGNLILTHTVSSLAKRAMMSERTLQRHFQEAMGLPVMQWLAQCRLDYARELLSSGSLSIARIAEVSGHSSEATFRHQFRLHETISPTQFRRQCRQKYGAASAHPPQSGEDLPR
ncbi:transcriptional regulator FtrA [Sodalis sp. RH20]|uniref:transcriptional regulator FtrA n=1 Tax=unclassified Sodalis (in: enterobacteria) TaxID=2636512 RepID=UPI0039B4FA97